MWGADKKVKEAQRFLGFGWRVADRATRHLSAAVVTRANGADIRQ